MHDLNLQFGELLLDFEGEVILGVLGLPVAAGR
jgi:hypothetical protein